MTNLKWTPPEIAYAQERKLILGSADSRTAIVTLWRPVEKLPLRTSEGLFAVAGTLYTGQGINELVRGLGLFNRVNRLVVWGPDTQKTGRALAELWRTGPVDGYIPGLPVRFDPSIDLRWFEDLRHEVELLVFPASASPEVVRHGMAGVGYNSQATARDMRFFDRPAPTFSGSLPARPAGYLIREKSSVAAAWEKLVRLVVRLGTDKGGDHGAQRELLGVTTVIDEPEGSYKVPHTVETALGVTEQTLLEYCDAFMSPYRPDGVEYAPGNRLQQFFGMDQITEGMVAQLKRNSDSRRAVATLWAPRADAESDSPPCVTEVQASITNGRVHVRATLRSSDALKAWYLDAHAILELQADLAVKLELEVGSVTIFTWSTHVYAADLPRAEEVASWYAHRSGPDFDPHGNLLVYPVPPTNIHTSWGVKVELTHPVSGEVIWSATGDWRVVTETMMDLQVLSDDRHKAYAAREIWRAHTEGPDYVQDRG